jgi:outer membrane receptor for ferrienterochelin and colicin
MLEEERTGGQLSFNRAKPLEEQRNIYGITIDSQNLEAFFKSGYIFPDDDEKSIAILANYVGHEQASMYGHHFYDGKQNYFTANLILKSHIGDSDKHHYNAGLSFMYDDLKEEYKQYYSPSIKQHLTGIQIFNGSRTEVVPGVFAQYTFNLKEILTFMAGLRWDYHNIFGGFITPRVHIRYNITELTSLRASAGKGYRTPNLMAEYNTLLASSRQFIQNEELKQEEGLNFGANITQYIPFAGRELIVNVEYYRTQFINQLIVDLDKSADEVWFYNLKGKSYSNVFQIETSVEILRGLNIVAAWRLNDVQTTTAGKLQRKSLQNRYKGLLTMSYSTPLQKWQFDFTSQFNGGGRVPITKHHSGISDKFNPYQIYNAQITKNFKYFSLYAGAENIGDFMQPHPVIDGKNPFGDNFDASLVWGPVVGRKFYFGFKFSY